MALPFLNRFRARGGAASVVASLACAAALSACEAQPAVAPLVPITLALSSADHPLPDARYVAISATPAGGQALTEVVTLTAQDQPTPIVASFDVESGSAVTLAAIVYGLLPATALPGIYRLDGTTQVVVEGGASYGLAVESTERALVHVRLRGVTHGGRPVGLRWYLPEVEHQLGDQFVMDDADTDGLRTWSGELPDKMPIIVAGRYDGTSQLALVLDGSSTACGLYDLGAGLEYACELLPIDGTTWSLCTGACGGGGETTDVEPPFVPCVLAGRHWDDSAAYYEARQLENARNLLDECTDASTDTYCPTTLTFYDDVTGDQLASGDVTVTALPFGSQTFRICDPDASSDPCCGTVTFTHDYAAGEVFTLVGGAVGLDYQTATVWRAGKIEDIAVVGSTIYALDSGYGRLFALDAVSGAYRGERLGNLRDAGWVDTGHGIELAAPLYLVVDGASVAVFDAGATPLGRQFVRSAPDGSAAQAFPAADLFTPGDAGSDAAVAFGPGVGTGTVFGYAQRWFGTGNPLLFHTVCDVLGPGGSVCGTFGGNPAGSTQNEVPVWQRPQFFARGGGSWDMFVVEAPAATSMMQRRRVCFYDLVHNGASVTLTNGLYGAAGGASPCLLLEAEYVGGCGLTLQDTVYGTCVKDARGLTFARNGDIYFADAASNGLVRIHRAAETTHTLCLVASTTPEATLAFLAQQGQSLGTCADFFELPNRPGGYHFGALAQADDGSSDLFVVYGYAQDRIGRFDFANRRFVELAASAPVDAPGLVAPLRSPYALTYLPGRDALAIGELTGGRVTAYHFAAGLALPYVGDPDGYPADATDLDLARPDSVGCSDGNGWPCGRYGLIRFPAELAVGAGDALYVSSVQLDDQDGVRSTGVIYRFDGQSLRLEVGLPLCGGMSGFSVDDDRNTSCRDFGQITSPPDPMPYLEPVELFSGEPILHAVRAGLAVAPGFGGDQILLETLGYMQPLGSLTVGDGSSLRVAFQDENFLGITFNPLREAVVRGSASASTLWYAGDVGQGAFFCMEGGSGTYGEPVQLECDHLATDFTGGVLITPLGQGGCQPLTTITGLASFADQSVDGLLIATANPRAIWAVYDPTGDPLTCPPSGTTMLMPLAGWDQPSGVPPTVTPPPQSANELVGLPGDVIWVGASASHPALICWSEPYLNRVRCMRAD